MPTKKASNPRVTLTLRLPKAERDTLAKHARAQSRTQSDIIRSFIRSLTPAARARAAAIDLEFDNLMKGEQ